MDFFKRLLYLAVGVFLVISFCSIEAFAKDDISDGIKKRFDKNEQLIEETTYKNGKKNGPWKYYSYGKDGKRGIAEEVNYVDGKRHGWLISRKWFFIMGIQHQTITTKSHYVNGKQDGLTAKFHAEGTLKSERIYKNGKIIDGVYESYDRHGNIDTIMYFENGKTEGWLLTFDSGKVGRKRFYKNGKFQRGSTVKYYTKKLNTSDELFIEFHGKKYPLYGRVSDNRFEKDGKKISRSFTRNKGKDILILYIDTRCWLYRKPQGGIYYNVLDTGKKWDVGKNTWANTDVQDADLTNPSIVYDLNGNKIHLQKNSETAEKKQSNDTPVIELNSKDAKGYYYRGVAYKKQSNYTQAIQNYTKAIELNPKYVKVYNELGWLYATAKDKIYRNGTKAVSFSLKAVSLKETAGYIDTLGAAYVENKQYEKAIASYQKVIEKDNTTTRIKKYQKLLKNKGYYSGPTDGIHTQEFDQAIRSCVRQGNYL